MLLQRVPVEAMRLNGSVAYWTSALYWETSSIDWCEANYWVSPYVAEFFNAFSNLPVVFGSLLLMWAARPYFRIYGYHGAGLATLMVATGVFSAYFHGTLAYAGQILDEVAIIWGEAYALAFIIPPTIYEHLGVSVKVARAVVFLTALIRSTLPYMADPSVSKIAAPMCFAFAALNVRIATKAISNYKPYAKDPAQLTRLLFHAVSWATAGLAVWLVDRLGCGHLPYVHGRSMLQLHALWHVLGFVAVHKLWVALLFVRALALSSTRRLFPAPCACTPLSLTADAAGASSPNMESDAQVAACHGCLGCMGAAVQHWPSFTATAGVVWPEWLAFSYVTVEPINIARATAADSTVVYEWQNSNGQLRARSVRRARFVEVFLSMKTALPSTDTGKGKNYHKCTDVLESSVCNTVNIDIDW